MFVILTRRLTLSLCCVIERLSFYPMSFDPTAFNLRSLTQCRSTCYCYSDCCCCCSCFVLVIVLVSVLILVLHIFIIFVVINFIFFLRLQGEVQEVIIHSGVNRATAVLQPGAVYKGQRVPTQVMDWLQTQVMYWVPSQVMYWVQTQLIYGEQTQVMYWVRTHA